MLGAHEATGRRILDRRQLRQEHEHLYLRQRVLHWRLALLLTGRLGAHRRALRQLEAQLTDEEAARFRWWAWAKRRRLAGLQVCFSAQLISSNSSCAWRDRCMHEQIPSGKLQEHLYRCRDQLLLLLSLPQTNASRERCKAQ